MKLGVLSDTHDQVDRLAAALTMLRDEGVGTIVHCGDLTSPETALALQGFRVIHTIGNGDIASGEIRRVLMSLDPQNYSGTLFTGSIEGVRIAVTHGHLADKPEDLARSGQYDFVFCGHSHIQRNDVIGFTRIVNPGALGRPRGGLRSFYLLDLDSRAGKFMSVPFSR